MTCFERSFYGDRLPTRSLICFVVPSFGKKKAFRGFKFFLEFDKWFPLFLTNCKRLSLENDFRVLKVFAMKSVALENPFMVLKWWISSEDKRYILFFLWARGRVKRFWRVGVVLFQKKGYGSEKGICSDGVDSSTPLLNKST